MKIMMTVFICVAAVLDRGAASVSGVIVRQVTPPVEHAEGPHWDSKKGVLYFVDISGHRLYQWNHKTDAVTFIDVGADIGFAIPVSGSGTLFLAGRERDLVYVPWTGEWNVTVDGGQLGVIASVDGGEGKEGNRFNDAKVDATGRLWAGTMGAEADGSVDPEKGTLYSLDADSSYPDEQVTSVTVSNGLAWNRDNTVMYYIDSPTGTIDAYDFDLEAGVMSDRRTVFSVPAAGLPGVPDGMTIDAEGMLWVALWGGNAVIQVDPSHNPHPRLLRQVTLPVTHVTSVAFGGVGLATLFVTTSRRGLSKHQLATQPLAGSVFAVHGLGVRGRKGHAVARGF